MARYAFERLSAQDLGFLLAEDERSPMHVGAVAILETGPLRNADGGVDVAYVRDLYDGEIRYVDRELGRLLDALRAAGMLERTLVIVTADHGESLGEHGEDTHSVFCYDSTLRVPFFLRHPDGRIMVDENGNHFLDDEIASVTEEFSNWYQDQKLG